jgi:hypothetical protein
MIYDHINTTGRRVLAAGFLFVCGLSGSGWTQQVSQAQLTVVRQPALERAVAMEKPAEQVGRPVNADQAIYLVRSTLLTLNDANRSGNYTVLRDLAAPDFQAKNSSADLAQIFADLRRRKFDLFAAALLSPQFSSDPALDPGGKLRLTGSFATRPLRITFDLTFQSVAGEWRLFAISVSTPEAPAAQLQLPRQMPKPFYGVRILSGTAGIRW